MSIKLWSTEALNRLVEFGMSNKGMWSDIADELNINLARGERKTNANECRNQFYREVKKRGLKYHGDRRNLRFKTVDESHDAVMEEVSTIISSMRHSPLPYVTPKEPDHYYLSWCDDLGVSLHYLVDVKLNKALDLDPNPFQVFMRLLSIYGSMTWMMEAIISVSDHHYEGRFDPKLLQFMMKKGNDSMELAFIALYEIPEGATVIVTLSSLYKRLLLAKQAQATRGEV